MDPATHPGMDAGMEIVAETDRLVLRRFTRSDPELLVELDGDPAVMRFLTGGQTTSRVRVETALLPAILRDYDRYPGFGAFATHTKADGEFIGWCMLVPGSEGPPGEAELGYRLRKAAWGRGYAAEGSRALIEYGFTARGLTRIFAETMAVNTQSRRVMEKVGLHYELTYIPPFAPIEGSEHGEVRYVLDYAEWQAARQRKNLQELS
ncbi:MAG TPA: GNAT family N-acetyltransferase [Actinophytocola sp.]|jgi:RimJ/RimL family protein N-acetyltransferase|nr:GNAT family N-acetyltransferase [Actinophytocola sp.]